MMKVWPVYNVAETPQDSFVPFVTNGLTEATITYSSVSEILRATQTLNSITADLNSNLPAVVASNDTVNFLHAGNDTNFKRTIIIRPNQALDIIQCFINMAFCLNVSAYTSGNFNIDTIGVIVRKRFGTNPTNKVKEIMNTNIATGLTALTATGAQVFILAAQFDGEMVDQGEQLEFEFTLNVTAGTGTRQEGYLPLFSPILANQLKQWFQSGIASHELTRVNSKNVIFHDDTPDVEIISCKKF